MSRKGPLHFSGDNTDMAEIKVKAGVNLNLNEI